MNNRNQTRKMTITAFLIALAIVIPIIMPIKIVIGPASYTLASHVPVFLAMFISPAIGVIVALGGAIGFFLAGFPITIVVRALGHVIFAFIGGHLIKNRQFEILSSPAKFLGFNLTIALIHGLTEFLIVSAFYLGGYPGAVTGQGFFVSIFLLVGVGTAIHSFIDLFIAKSIFNMLEKQFKGLIG